MDRNLFFSCLKIADIENTKKAESFLMLKFMGIGKKAIRKGVGRGSGPIAQYDQKLKLFFYFAAKSLPSKATAFDGQFKKAVLRNANLS